MERVLRHVCFLLEIVGGAAEGQAWRAGSLGRGDQHDIKKALTELEENIIVDPTTRKWELCGSGRERRCALDLPDGGGRW